MRLRREAANKITSIQFLSSVAEHPAFVIVVVGAQKRARAEILNYLIVRADWARGAAKSVCKRNATYKRSARLENLVSHEHYRLHCLGNYFPAAKLCVER